MKWLIGVVAVACVIMLFAWGLSRFTVENYTARVVGKYHEDGYTSMDTSYYVDSNGTTQMMVLPVYHPPEYYVRFINDNGDQIVKMFSHMDWEFIKDGDEMILSRVVRKSKLSAEEPVY